VTRGWAGRGQECLPRGVRAQRQQRQAVERHRHYRCVCLDPSSPIFLSLSWLPPSTLRAPGLGAARRLTRRARGFCSGEAVGEAPGALQQHHAVLPAQALTPRGAPALRPQQPARPREKMHMSSICHPRRRRVPRTPGPDRGQPGWAARLPKALGDGADGWTMRNEIRTQPAQGRALVAAHAG
jgi:hypothetical protein